MFPTQWLWWQLDMFQSVLVYMKLFLWSALCSEMMQPLDWEGGPQRNPSCLFIPFASAVWHWLASYTLTVHLHLSKNYTDLSVNLLPRFNFCHIKTLDPGLLCSLHLVCQDFSFLALTMAFSAFPCHCPHCLPKSVETLHSLSPRHKSGSLPPIFYASSLHVTPKSNPDCTSLNREAQIHSPEIADSD